jgi:hypothetical protein
MKGSKGEQSSDSKQLFYLYRSVTCAKQINEYLSVKDSVHNLYLHNQLILV